MSFDRSAGLYEFVEFLACEVNETSKSAFVSTCPSPLITSIVVAVEVFSDL